MEYVLLTVFPEKEKTKGGRISKYVKESHLIYDKVIAITRNRKSELPFKADNEMDIDGTNEEVFMENLTEAIDSNCDDSCIYDICGYDSGYDLIKVCYLLREKGLYFRILASKCYSGEDNEKPILPLILMGNFPGKVVM